MANIKSQIKRNRQNERRHQRNVAAKSSLKTSQKKVLTAAAAGDADGAADLHRQTARDIDKAASKGILSKKTAARRKSRLAKSVSRTAATS
jgi:small subunit ribosomal protein S20